MIYLDYQATTPLAPEAFAAMEPWLKDHFANPHSAHKAGRAAAAAVEAAREEIAALLPSGGRVIFTSGATEALNLAIIGSGCGANIWVPATEHAAVLDTAAYLGGNILPVGQDGSLDAEDMPGLGESRGLRAMLAAMLVNNETGYIHPVADLADAAHRAGALFLCDAVQAFGRVPIPAGPDMIAISAHKIHGPKGIGALWVRDGVALSPQMHGGGQEQSMRSGTLSPALCAGFGAAARVARERMDADAAHVADLSALAAALFAGWTVNGAQTGRYPGNLNIRRDGLDVARLMSDCRDIAFSAGSACASGSGRTSHVLQAIGLSDAQAKSSIRIGFGRYTSADDIAAAARQINAAADAQISA